LQAEFFLLKLFIALTLSRSRFGTPPILSLVEARVGQDWCIFSFKWCVFGFDSLWLSWLVMRAMRIAG